MTTSCQDAPESRARPADFGILIEGHWRNRINTFEGQVTKDLVMRGDTTIALRLTDAELDTLYRTVLKLDTFELPEPHPAATQRAIMPRTATHVLVRSRGHTREFRWETGFEPTRESESQWQRLVELVKVTRRMVERHPAYIRLPAPEGGYM